MHMHAFLSEIFRPYWRFLSGALLCLTVAITSFKLTPIVLKYVINALAAKNATHLILFACLLCLLNLTSNTFFRITSFLQLRYAEEMFSAVNLFFYRAILQKPHRFFKKYSVGFLTTHITQATSSFFLLFFMVLNECLSMVIAFSITMLIFMSLNPLFSINLLALYAIYIYLLVKGIPMLQKKAYAAKTAHAAISTELHSMYQNILAIILFEGRSHEQEQLRNYHERYVLCEKEKLRTSLVLNAIQKYLFKLYQLGSLILLVRLYHANAITPGDFALVLSSNLIITDVLQSFATIVPEALKAWSAIAYMLALTEEDALCTKQHLPLPALYAPAGEITFHRVSFSYTPTKPLFKELSLTIPAGQKVGIIGESGSGKSTFIHLLLKLQKPQSGTISIDKQDIALTTDQSLYDAISFVPQNGHLFKRSVKENIAYNMPGLYSGAIKHAAQLAAAHSFAKNLAEGYNSIIGDKTCNLSGGQMQRVLLARALAKTAPILVLDEATSHLDAITEQTVRNNLYAWLTKEKNGYPQTTIIIAHRLSTLLHVDRILVFKHGAIIQDGPHRELIMQPGLYQTLWKQQEIDIPTQEVP